MHIGRSEVQKHWLNHTYRCFMKFKTNLIYRTLFVVTPATRKCGQTQLVIGCAAPRLQATQSAVMVEHAPLAFEASKKNHAHSCNHSRNLSLPKLLTLAHHSSANLPLHATDYFQITERRPACTPFTFSFQLLYTLCPHVLFLYEL